MIVLTLSQFNFIFAFVFTLLFSLWEKKKLKNIFYLYLGIFIIVVSSFSYSSYLMKCEPKFVNGISRNMYLEGSELVKEDSSYYVKQPNDISKLVHKIELKENQNELISTDDSKAIFLVDCVQELNLGLIIVRDYNNILYLDEELYNIYIHDNIILSFSDYIEGDLLEDDGSLK